MCVVTGLGAGIGELLGGVTSGEVAAGAAVASTAIGAGTALASRGRRAVMPPNPLLPAGTVNQEAQQADANAMQREAIAGGIQSTVGPAGAGQGGYMLNPGDLGQKQLLGQ